MNEEKTLRSVGHAGFRRLAAAGVVGILLAIVYAEGILSPGGVDISTGWAALLALGLIVMIALPVMSQFTRGEWSADGSGIAEQIRPLVPMLPFGLHRQRHIRWGDITGHRLVEVGTRGRRSIAFRINVRNSPPIVVYRKERGNDGAFERFVAVVTAQLTA
jgi:hypothetical protein